MSWNPNSLDFAEGKKAVVTGSDSGIGFRLVEYLVENGATVIAACERLDEDLRRQQSLADMDAVERRHLNLSSKQSIEEFAESNNSEIDLLANNAGIMNVPWGKTDFGFEMQFGVNFLGHFYLTSLLDEKLHEESSVVTTTSMAHKSGELDYEELNSREDYSPWGAYADSKLACLLFALELNERASYRSNAAHPGFASTNLFKRGPEERGSRVKLAVSEAAVKVLGQSPKKGSWPLLYALGLSEGGKMAGPSGLFQMRGSPEIQEPQTEGFDRKDLWEFAEDQMDTNFL